MGTLKSNGKNCWSPWNVARRFMTTKAWTNLHHQRPSLQIPNHRQSPGAIETQSGISARGQLFLEHPLITALKPMTTHPQALHLRLGSTTECNSQRPGGLNLVTALVARRIRRLILLIILIPLKAAGRAYQERIQANTGSLILGHQDAKPRNGNSIKPHLPKFQITWRRVLGLQNLVMLATNLLKYMASISQAHILIQCMITIDRRIEYFVWLLLRV